MDINYVYVKRRREFGKQPLFSQSGTDLVDSILPDTVEQKKYILRNPVHQPVQVSLPFSENSINTIRVKMVSTGVNHDEGGWPKEVNHLDEEAVARYKRKIEREDDYVEAVLKLAPRMIRLVNQNNAINHYQQYYNELAPMPDVESHRMLTVNHFADPYERPVSSIAWTAEHDSKMVVSYCNKNYERRLEPPLSTKCYIWNIENPKEPADYFEPITNAWQIEPSPRTLEEYVAGLSSGQVCLFDSRTGPEHVAICPEHVAHREPVSALSFINSRSLTEFFTGSSDGQCIWWDYRDLSEPFEQITMTTKLVPNVPPTISNAQGITSLYYDRNLPTRYLAGTETGIVINVNRKGKTLQEMMSAQWFAHTGTVRALQRNPSIIKLFLTCGDFTVKLWSEDTKTDYIINTNPFRHEVCDAAWSPNRVSAFFTATKDGCMQYFDVLRSYKHPLFITKMTDNKPTKLKLHEEGRLVAVGDAKGLITLMAVTESMQYSGDQDKALLLQLFDRENRREHILEARLKEIRLKLREADKLDETAPADDDAPDENAILKAAHEDYIDTVEGELRKYNKLNLNQIKDKDQIRFAS